MKRFIVFLVISALVFVLAACGGDTTSEGPAETPENVTEENTTGGTDNSASEESQVFTLEELSQYNGQDGNPAYVAVDGVVYDVSDIEPWADGEHFNGVVAGVDNTDEISKSPHGKSVLENLPIVGTLE